MTVDSDLEAPVPSQQSRHWALGAHISGLCAGYVIPFGGIVAPLVIWLVKKEEDPYVGDQALEALNFQITVLLAAIASAVLLIVGIGFLLLIAVGIGDLVLAVLAAIAASEGRDYRYPFTLRLVSG